MGGLSLGLLSVVASAAKAIIQKVEVKPNPVPELGAANVLPVEKPPPESVTTFTLCRNELIVNRGKPRPALRILPKPQQQHFEVPRPAEIDGHKFKLVLPHDSKRALRLLFEVRPELAEARVHVTFRKGTYSAPVRLPHEITAMRLEIPGGKSVPLPFNNSNIVDRAELVRHHAPRAATAG